jgi:chemotaxis protein methyltransferase CheR
MSPARPQHPRSAHDDPPRLRPEDYLLLQALMRRRAGISLEGGKEYLAEARLAALALQLGYGTLRALMESLQTEGERGELHRAVVESLAITETSFFRDLHPFEALKNRILPERVSSRTGDRCLNIWSAACSSGQEPYSIAMLIRERFPQLVWGGVRLIASDLSNTVLERARAGVFTKIEVNRGLPAPMLVRYFTQVDQSWKIRDDVRGMIEFRELNLAASWPSLPFFDVIFLRNVLLYFDAETRRHVLRNVAKCLRPDGVLVLGGGETTLTLDDSYEPVQIDRAVCYRLVPADRARPRKAA